MHILQPKHIKIKPDEVKNLIKELNVNVSQLPKIKSTDRGLPSDCVTGDVVKIERFVEGKLRLYYRVVV